MSERGSYALEPEPFHVGAAFPCGGDQVLHQWWGKKSMQHSRALANQLPLGVLTLLGYSESGRTRSTPLSFKSSWNWRLKLAMEKRAEPLKCCFYNAISLYQRVFSWKRGFQTRLRHTYTWPTMDRSSCATGTVISVWWPEDFGNLPIKIDPNFEFLILCISMGAALTSSLVFLAGRATAEELLGPQNVQEIMLFIAVGIKQRAWKKWQTDANSVLEIWLLNTY